MNICGWNYFTVAPANTWLLASKYVYLIGLGMRNLQHEIRMCQKHHNKVTMTMPRYF